jgi:hypothetical protein
MSEREASIRVGKSRNLEVVDASRPGVATHREVESRTDHELGIRGNNCVAEKGA